MNKKKECFHPAKVVWEKRERRVVLLYVVINVRNNKRSIILSSCRLNSAMVSCFCHAVREQTVPGALLYLPEWTLHPRELDLR